MRVALVLSVLIPSIVFAQVQGDSFSAGSNLTGVACRVNESQSDLADTEGEANFCATDKKANILVGLRVGTASATNPIKSEDSNSTSGDGGIVGLYKRQDQIATGEVGGNSRYGFGLIDTVSRFYVNPWGAAVTEFFTATSAADVTTSTTSTLKASVASNRHYISSFSCTNTGGTATRVDLEDGAGTKYDFCNLAATTGSCTKEYPTPLRQPSASNLVINVITGGSATRCAATGFISPY